VVHGHHLAHHQVVVAGLVDGRDAALVGQVGVVQDRHVEHRARVTRQAEARELVDAAAAAHRADAGDRVRALEREEVDAEGAAGERQAVAVAGAAQGHAVQRRLGGERRVPAGAHDVALARVGGGDDRDGAGVVAEEALGWRG
jgi:hypothetical protein